MMVRAPVAEAPEFVLVIGVDLAQIVARRAAEAGQARSMVGALDLERELADELRRRAGARHA
ncbi:MAG: hypothetical protein CVV51_09575 [Spirochaetae bacterium HGW-Spirochaetae-7]|jgi:hypothetical protein|nr:MAG: hypothetical protein CVV51_09575 [Spirochaetae bacterium HGW-Spirochaetae-7]